MRKMMRKCQIHFVSSELGYESSYWKRGAGNGVQSHNWMFVPGQFFRANYQRMGYIAGTALWRWETVGALRGKRDALIKTFSTLG